MSLSKERSVSAELTVAAAEQSRRQPKCTRCRHHGIIIPKKGHMKHCPFLQCDCWTCYIITQRTRITAVQRNQKKNHPKSKEQGPGGHTGVTVVKVEVQGTSSAAAPDGAARPSATSGRVCLPADGASERAATAARSPLDLRSRAAAGREAAAGLDYGKVPSASSEEQTCAPHFNEFGQTAPLPFIHFPLEVLGHFSSGYAPCPNFLLNMPWMPPVPAGLYNEGLHGSLMFSHFQSHAVHYPPAGLPADRKPVFFTLQPPPLPEPVQDALMSRQLAQPPLPSHDEPSGEELD